jgi:molybdopterin synthase sulfur carrier subunit
MIKVEFLGPIGVDSIELDIKSLKELASYMQKDEKLKEWVDISAVAVNDVVINSLDYKLKDGDRVSILPPVCGG